MHQQGSRVVDVEKVTMNGPIRQISGKMVTELLCEETTVPRRFNVAGPCKPEIHYMLPAAARVPLARRLVADQNYFVIHAPRQSGKTTAMIDLAQELTASGDYVAVLVSVEVGAAFNDDPGAAELAILSNWRNAAAVRLPAEMQPPSWPVAEAGDRDHHRTARLGRSGAASTRVVHRRDRRAA